VNKKYLIAGGLAAVAGLLLVAIWLLSSSAQSDNLARPAELPDHQFEDWGLPIDDPEGLSREARSLFEGIEVLSYEDLIRAARKGEVSLVSELWRLRRNCPEEMERYDCNIRIRQFIMEKFLPPGNEQLVELLTKYLKYEEEMSRFEMPRGASLQEQYQLIREKRRDFFGPEDSKLVFGFEEAKADYASTYADFQKDTVKLSGDARLTAYEEMRKKVYGDYYETVVAREPKFTKYETEVELRGSDLSAMAADQKGAYVAAMREKYFGKEGAARMAAVDAQIAERDQTLETYRDAEAEFLKNNAHLNESERARKLMEMRVKYFGQDEAEAYTRRESYEKAMKELRNK
jgi:lipase chaperone LimK